MSVWWSQASRSEAAAAANRQDMVRIEHRQARGERTSGCRTKSPSLRSRGDERHVICGSRLSKDQVTANRVRSADQGSGRGWRKQRSEVAAGVGAADGRDLLRRAL